jgi:hypothetical protein
VLDRLNEAVRSGKSRALVVRGGPGVGMTALLDYLAGQAPGCRVARAGSREKLAGHDDALDLVGALVDLGDRGPAGSFPW